MKRTAAALAGCLALAAGAHAEVYVQLDNDLGMETDRWYSSGFRVARVERRESYEIEWGLLHEIYTPDVKHFRFEGGDRMPTARLLASLARHDRSPQRFRTLELDVGVRGPSAGGRAVTRAIHRVVRARPIDWSRQDRDRLDAQLVAAFTRPALDAFHMHYGAVLGTELAFVHVGAELRFGPRAEAAPFSPAMRFAATPPAFAPCREGCWSAFLGASARAVLRNEMIGPNYAPLLPPLERRRGVARLAGGLSWAWPRGAVSLTLVRESKEFAQQATGHTFGSLVGYLAF